MNLTKLQTLLNVAEDKDAVFKEVQRIFQSVTRHLLVSQRFYGELLLRLPLQIDRTAKSALGLHGESQLSLVVNPDLLIANDPTDAQLTARIEHEIGHLAWQHPIRYQTMRQQSVVTLATDIVVNDHLKTLYPGAVTRGQLNFKLDLKLPANLGSEAYIKLIQAAIQSDYSGQRASQVKALAFSATQSHLGWQRLSKSSTAKLHSLVSDAWHDTPSKQRGQYPIQLQRQLTATHPSRSLNWRRLIMLGLNGPQIRLTPTHNRFNRRQPYRLELPGQSHTTVKQLLIFVDESGSVTNSELEIVFGQLQQLLKQYQNVTTILPFDTIVHVTQQQTLRSANQLRLVRVAGGGTSFQAIFDYLQRNHYENQNAVAVILTDGHGEKRVTTHNFTNVVWCLTTQMTDLSLQHPVGTVTLVKE